MSAQARKTGRPAGPARNYRVRMVRPWLLLWIACACACGCAAGTAHQPAPQHAPAAAKVDDPPLAPAASAPGTATAAKAETAAPAEPPAPGAAPQAPAAAASSLPEQLEAGDIARASLNAVLSAGVGRFLQHVQAEARLQNGRFTGWRLVHLFDDGSGLLLQPGDIVLRVNGQSIERPEQFQNVWQSMATASDLVLDVERGGKRSQLRYRIVD